MKTNQINWILRLKNKTTLSALIGIVVVACFQIAQLFGLNLTVNQEQIMQVVEFVLTLLAGWGIIIDPTTQGSKDSQQALNYTEPKKQEDNQEESDPS